MKLKCAKFSLPDHNVILHSFLVIINVFNGACFWGGTIGILDNIGLVWKGDIILLPQNERNPYEHLQSKTSVTITVVIGSAHQ